MKVVSVVLPLDDLTYVFDHVRVQSKEYGLVNQTNGDQISFEPDIPSTGFVTITAINQLEED